jgi:branched-chain amino acid transport system substrate-binding protein
MKKSSGVVAIVVVVLAAIGVAWYLGAKNSSPKEPIRVGVIGHFSGAYADYGIPMKNGIELAVDKVNESGGIKGRQVQLVAEDDNSDPAAAATAMNKLVSVDNVDYILSAQGSGVTAAVTPIAQSNKKIEIITLGSAPDLTKVGNYIFRSIPSDVYQATKMVDLINGSLNSRKVAGLYINDAYGVGIKGIINANTRVENVDSEMFESQATDFRTQLLKIKESGADTLVVVAHTEYPLILKQIKELNLSARIVASETFKDEGILKQSGSSAEGALVTFPADPKDYVNFSAAYQDKFNEKASAYSMYAYDGFIALSQAIAKGGNSIEAVKNNLPAVQFDGASGKFGFSADRDRTGTEYTVYNVENGNFVTYQ